MKKKTSVKAAIFGLILLGSVMCAFILFPSVESASAPHEFKGYAFDKGLHPIEDGTVIRAMVVDSGGGGSENYTTTVNNSLPGINYDFQVQDPEEDNAGRPIYFYIGTENTAQSVSFVVGGLNVGFAVYYNLTIFDIPQITDNSPTTGTTGDSFTFNVTVVDYVDSANELTVNVSWSHGSLSYNKTLSPVGGNYFIGTNTTALNSIANMIYTIWVNDTSSNMNHSGPHSVTITDNDNPTSSVNTISGYWKKLTNNPLSIIGTASDNIGLKNVTIWYRYRAINSSIWGGWVRWNNASNPDANPWSGVSWNFNFPNTSGHYQFYSVAVDNASNQESKSSAETGCGYDTVAPSTVLTGLTTYKKANFLVQWSVGTEVTSGVASWTVQCRNGSGGSWTAWLTNVSYVVRSATWQITNFSNSATIYFRALAVDNASNVGTWSNLVSTTRDTIAPTSEVTDITPYWQNTSSITIQATASDGTSGLKYVVLYYYNSTDNLTWTGPWTSGNDTTPWSGVSWTFTFLNGTNNYQFYSRATDNATNTEGVPTTNDTICYYNNTYPDTPSSPSPANGTTYTTGVRPSALSWTGGDINNDSVNYTLYVRASNSTFNASYIHGYTENVTSHSIVFSWSTTYYWKIVATDEHEAVSVGPIWHFTTGAESGGGSSGPSGSENTAPTAEAGGPYIEYVNATITFNASESTDADGRIIGYKWDWTNDGTWDTDWLTSPATTHVYTLAGNYTVRLQVKDNGSATDDDTASVTIQELPVIYASQEALDFLNSSFGLEFTTPFYGTDTNGDGIVDTFTDPNHLLTLVRFANIDGSASFLLSIGNDDIPEFFWDTATNTTTLIHHSVGAIIDTVDNTDTKMITMTISVEKANWTYIEVADLYPDNPDLIVKTADGRTISSEMIWRKDGKIFILDDPVTEYQIIYSYAQGPLFDVTLTLTPDSVSVGADISALITLVNVGEPGLVNGTVTFTLYKGGEVVWSSEENVSVLSQKTFTKTIPTDGLSPGSYTYKVIYSYAGGQTASAQGIFSVEAVQQPLWENILVWAIIIIILIIIMIIVVLFKLDYLYFDKKEK